MLTGISGPVTVPESGGYNTEENKWCTNDIVNQQRAAPETRPKVSQQLMKFSCSSCGKKVFGAKALNLHINLCDAPSQQLHRGLCLYCDRKLGSAPRLNLHIKMCHTPYFPIQDVMNLSQCTDKPRYDKLTCCDCKKEIYGNSSSVCDRHKTLTEKQTGFHW